MREDEEVGDKIEGGERGEDRWRERGRKEEGGGGKWEGRRNGGKRKEEKRGGREIGGKMTRGEKGKGWRERGEGRGRGIFTFISTERTVSMCHCLLGAYLEGEKKFGKSICNITSTLVQYTR